MKTRVLVLGLLPLVSVACTSSWSGSGSGPVTQSTPVARPSIRAPFQGGSFRVVEASTGNTVSFAALVGRAAQSDIVYFGEQHDDPETHFLEFALLEGLGRRHDQVVLSLEMFERDVQADLDRYLAGTVTESTFLATARPWPRYATDYRSMVQLARARAWRVVASNIPRPMANAISRRGMRALDTLTSLERARAAAAMVCPMGDDEYFRKFSQAMSGHGAGGGPPTASDTAAAVAMTVRFYEAQCAKDETMAESIARALADVRGRGVMLHVNGAFHSDYGLGTAERVRRRMPGVRQLVITAVPVENPGSAVVGTHAGKADFVIFTRRQ